MLQNVMSRANGGRVSLPLIFSYILDWAVIIIAAIIGAVLQLVTPNKRPFSLTNPELSYPYVKDEKIPTALLGILGVVAPAVIIFVICILVVPGPTVPKSVPKALIWQRKLWEWHTGWLGLALSLASAFLITQGMKNAFGKPRPDLLSRCKPDIDNRENYAIGGFAGVSSEFLLYSAKICQNTDKELLDEGFRSYPSGHASFSAAGLIYLSLFIASKFALTIPFLPPSLYSSDETRVSAFPSRLQHSRQLEGKGTNTLSQGQNSSEPLIYENHIVAARNQAAAPPVYLLVLTIIPWFASIYIASTRYSDFRHHGFDILFGYFIGIVSAIFAFRYYHLPISQGAGWSWGPRSRERSFWAGVGVGNYAGNKNGTPDRSKIVTEMDTENGQHVKDTDHVELAYIHQRVPAQQSASSGQPLH